MGSEVRRVEEEGKLQGDLTKCSVCIPSGRCGHIYEKLKDTYHFTWMKTFH